MPPPVRTCVGCRRRADKSELLRLVWCGGPVVDPRQVDPGRGAYLHPREACLELAVKRRALSRAWRLPAGVAVDPAPLRAAVIARLVPEE